MTSHDTDDLRVRLDSLLSRERDALLSGDLHLVGALTQEKEALLTELETSAPETLAAVQDLRDAARRNQALLDGALEGIRRAAARLSAYRRLRSTMDTYDPKGRKTTIAGALAHTVQRRA